MGFPLNLALLLLLLLVINWMTFSGAWWLKWAVIALAVAWVGSLLRVVGRMLSL